MSSEQRSVQKILINGAGGGVGTIAIQLAKLEDVEVTGVDSAAKLEMMRTLGYDHVIDGPYALTEARDAFRRFGDGAQKGKVVITM